MELCVTSYSIAISLLPYIMPAILKWTPLYSYTTHHFYTHVRSGKTLFHYLLMPWSRYPGRLRIIAEDITEGQSAEELDNDVTRINISNCCCDHDKLNSLAS